MAAVVLYAHPYPHRSRAGRALLAGVRDLPFVSVRALYSLYPDLAIDVDAEKQALLAANVIVWQAPFYWYGAPAILHLWFEKVLEQGWAYGDGGDALRGKRVLWVATTGGVAASYAPGEMHGHPFSEFVPAFQQTAVFCGMEWEPPIIVHGAHRIDDVELARVTTLYRERLVSLEERRDG